MRDENHAGNSGCHIPPAKSKAAERGIPLRQFVTEAVEEKLKNTPFQPGKQPWMELIGQLKHLHEENVRIDKIIEEEFEQIAPELWK